MRETFAIPLRADESPRETVARRPEQDCDRCLHESGRISTSISDLEAHPMEIADRRRAGGDRLIRDSGTDGAWRETVDVNTLGVDLFVHELHETH
jgi:hypothetical protein